MGGPTVHVDHTGMSQLKTVAGNQATYLQTTQGYINGACARPDAFGGVLAIFRSNYEEVLTNADSGMVDAQHVSHKMAETAGAAHREYIVTDRLEAARHGKATAALDGEGYSSGVGDSAKETGNDLAKKAAGVKEEDTKVKSPVDYAKDRLKHKILGPDDPHKPTVDSIADKRNQERIQHNYQQNRGDMTRSQAKKQRKLETQDVAHKKTIVNGVGAAKDTYDEVKSVYTNGKQVLDDIHETKETVKDIHEYDDYEGKGNNNDALRNWANS